MATLVGVMLMYVTLVSGVPGTGVSVQVDICAPGAGTCRSSAEAPGGAPDPEDAYATPVEVDCRALLDAPIGPEVEGLANRGDGFSGAAGCAAPAFDYRYRVSRFPDSERAPGSLGPSRGRRTTAAAATCGGRPSDRGTVVLASVPPAALCALPHLPPPLADRMYCDDARRTATRTLEPLERPPRA